MDWHCGTEELYRRYWRLVRGVARSHLHVKADADDVAQEVFLSLDRVLPRLRSGTNFRGFLVVAARNRALSWNRRRGRRGEEQLRDAPPPAAAQPPEISFAALDLGHALSLLPPKQAEVVGLRLGMGLTLEEISVRLGEPLGTVKSRLLRGVRRLRLAFARPA